MKDWPLAEEPASVEPETALWMSQMAAASRVDLLRFWWMCTYRDLGALSSEELERVRTTNELLNLLKKGGNDERQDRRGAV